MISVAQLRRRGDLQPELFVVRSDVTSAGGLFADVAGGRNLGDVVLRLYSPGGVIYQTWTLENAEVVSYRLLDEGKSETSPPMVELAFGFSDIATTFPPPYEGNLISGNATGVSISGSGSTANIVVGNFIGIDASGVTRLPNNRDGVRIVDSSGNRIGGTQLAERNVISGNAGDGIAIEGGANLPYLVSVWNAEGDAADSLGGNDGEINGAGFTSGVRGGQAFNFDGVDDFVRVSQSPELESDNITLGTWIRSSGPAKPIEYFAAKGGQLNRAASWHSIRLTDRHISTSSTALSSFDPTV